ncbi:cytochrome c oxidase subunit 2 [Herbaspirillum sp. Sphag1AN]|uniref:cupredoxin domain-containing protein n=1 Tax=unclassified Herbaspirillum TaxID=2624150 RepID=UPI00161A5205|nr:MULTISPECIES: cupredoxin domain-containing protein [unclassified Herbaspirillum]MBB3214280.1 cytochrome c oxidase subunit 2 [Herbaspirillum sp. Sphag1AN]MBB3247332.1 cytochrome c oxidase subunit 2 [Herbaspirillum sp. Sphag64]
MRSSRRQFLRRILGSSGAVLCGGSLLAEAAGETSQPQPARVIRIEAKKFTYTPNEIAIQQGESVILDLTALDFVHGFNIPDLHVRADIVPGKATRLPLQFPSAGKISFLCDNFCGSGHEEMGGNFNVIAS